MGKVYEALKKAAPEPMVTSTEPQTTSAPPRSQGQSVVTARNESLRSGQDGSQHTEHPWDPRLVIASNRSTTIAEDFKRLRTKILHPMNGKKISSIMVTSAIPEEGKSFVCANLGITLAQSMEHHALLIDCDLRRPSLAGLFGHSSDKGLSDYLIHGTDLTDLTLETSQDALQLIPSGRPPRNPAELLTSNKMRNLLTDFQAKFPDHFIFLDSAPMHAASETAVLAKYVDAVVLVVRWGRSRREQVRQVVDLIGKDKILGIVFNAYQINELEARVMNYYYDYGYGYGYGYDNYYASDAIRKSRKKKKKQSR